MGRTGLRSLFELRRSDDERVARYRALMQATLQIHRYIRTGRSGPENNQTWYQEQLFSDPDLALSTGSVAGAVIHAGAWACSALTGEAMLTNRTAADDWMNLLVASPSR
jgi:hypothetical protein